MQSCIDRVCTGGLLMTGSKLDKRYYGEDGHLIAISLLYDIAIYVSFGTLSTLTGQEGMCAS